MRNLLRWNSQRMFCSPPNAANHLFSRRSSPCGNFHFRAWGLFYLNFGQDHCTEDSGQTMVGNDSNRKAVPTELFLHEFCHRLLPRINNSDKNHNANSYYHLLSNHYVQEILQAFFQILTTSLKNNSEGLNHLFSAK